MLSIPRDFIPFGEVRVLFYPLQFDLESWLEHVYQEQENSSRIITHTWNKIPVIHLIQEDIIVALARIALGLWPRWYRDSVETAFHKYPDLDGYLANQFLVKKLFQERDDISMPWLNAAISCCRHSRLPIMSEFPLSEQANQLSLALFSIKTIIILYIKDRQPLENRLLGLVRSAEWLAKNANVSVLLLLPKEFSCNPDIDSVLYQAVTLFEEKVLPDELVKEESKHIIWPINGIPHPFSPGEQKLAAALAKDTELGGLFAFNQSIVSTRNSRYLVDLLWQEGAIIVEIDGYRHHRNRYAFYQDRHRDYELILSGYTVLRLTHEEVMDDVVLAMEKIRDIVKLRKRNLITERIQS